MTKTLFKLLPFAALSLALSPSVTIADALELPAGSQGAYLGNIERPTLGQSKADVEAMFGSPSKKYSAIGEPPITRWDYEKFSVYFENDSVLHSVLKHKRQD